MKIDNDNRYVRVRFRGLIEIIGASIFFPLTFIAAILLSIFNNLVL